MAALDAAAAGRTTLVVAHRLATVRRAATIAVLDRGIVVERGTHAELVAAGGAYAALVAAQANMPAPKAQASAPARLGLVSSPSASHSDDETNDEDEDDVSFRL